MAVFGIGTTFDQAFGGLWLQRWILGAVAGGWLVAEYLFLSARRYFLQDLWPDVVDRLSAEGLDLLASDRAYVGHLVAEVPHNLYGAVFVLLVLRVLLFGTLVPQSGPGRVLGRAILFLFMFKMSMALYFATSHWLSYKVTGGLAIAPWRPMTWLIGAAITSRLCLIYPNSAMGLGWQLRRSWRDGAGNALRLFGMYMLVVLPGLAIGEGLEIVIRLSAADLGANPASALILLAALKRIAISVTLLALFVAAFVRLTDFQAAGMPGAERTPEQLAEAFD